MTLHRSDGSLDEKVSADERSTLRVVAMPTEHGGWSLTLEPVLLGLLATSHESSRGRGDDRMVGRRRSPCCSARDCRGRGVQRRSSSFGTSTAKIIGLQQMFFGILVVIDTAIAVLA